MKYLFLGTGVFSALLGIGYFIVFYGGITHVTENFELHHLQVSIVTLAIFGVTAFLIYKFIKIRRKERIS